MARRTVQINHLENRIEVFDGMAEQAANWFNPCSIDAVICNPPYGVPGAAVSSPFSSRAISRNQQKDTLSGFFRSAFMILKGKGTFTMVYPAPQPKRFQLVYPYENRPANLVLIEAVKDAKPTLHPMPPLIIYRENHILTNRLKSVYHID